jgi:hypothetical protein
MSGMKKSTLALTLTVTLLIAMLTGCGSTPTTNSGTQSPTISSSNKVTAEEQVLFEQQGIKLTLKGFEDSLFGPELKVLVENNSDVPITVQTRDVSVNGYMMSAVMFSSDVAPGKKNNDTITFMSSELESSGISTISTIELSFHVFNSDSWDSIFDTDTIAVNTSAAGSISQSTTAETKSIVFEQGGIKISFVDFDTKSFLGAGIKFYIENSSETPITVQVRDTSINGFMLDGMMSCDVMPGKVANTSLDFFDSDLEENRIDKIESVELKFHIFDKDSWDTIFDTDVIVLTQ